MTRFLMPLVKHEIGEIGGSSDASNAKNNK